jgi:DNA ligase-1
MAKTILYLVDNRKATRYWEAELDSDGIYTRWGVVGGEEQEEFEEVLEGKSNRTKAEQMYQMYLSKIKKKMEKGYKRTIAEARQSGRETNSIGLPSPMLATSLKKLKNIPEEYFVQPKLDGHRCLYDFRSGTAYSRNGKHIDAIWEIKNELQSIPGEYNFVIDGELYHHGTPLQKLSSWVKRRQEGTLILEYYVYDVVCDKPFSERYELLRELSKHFQLRVKLCPTTRSNKDPYEWLAGHRSVGYEGTMIRLSDSVYESGVRSKSLIKVKALEDDEFVVESISEAKNGAGILNCRIKDKIFSVTAPGTLREKMHVYRNKHIFIGRKVRVEYAMLTNDGIPFHPVATMWRDKEDE